MMAQTETFVTPNGKKVKMSPKNNANNGLTAVNDTVQFGGNLTKATTLTTTDKNTLSIKGLEDGNSRDQLLIIDSLGVVKKTDNTNWNLNGNSGTNSKVNFIGTTDARNLVFRRNDTISGIISGRNTSFGYKSYQMTAGTENVAIGVNALTKNSGSFNVGIGTDVLKNNGDWAWSNTAVGSNAMENNVSGTTNQAFGNRALQNNTSGSANSAIGTDALSSNTSGKENIAIGNSALINNTTGNRNIAIGHIAFLKNETGNFNLIMGDYALGAMTSGNYNIALGNNAGLNYLSPATSEVTKMNSSIMIGSQSYPLENNGTNEIVIGTGARGKGSNTVQIGDAKMITIGGAVNWSIGSDIRLKKDIATSTYGLNFINKLRPVTYKMKTGTTDLQSGFIAQEVETAANSIGYEFNGIVKPQNDSDFYSLRYAEFVVPLVKAVQEQQKLIEEQEKLIGAKDAKILEIEERLLKLEQKMK